MKECWRYFRHKLVKISEITPPKLILLSTDGYSNSFAKANDFLSIGKDYLNLLNESDPKEIQSHLKDFLESTSQTGSGDDISFIILILSEN